VRENPEAEGTLRLIILGVATRTGDEAEAGAMTDGVGGEPNACDGLTTGADEHASPDTVTVVVESNRTVLTPSAPVELNMDVPFDAPGSGVAVDAGAEDEEETIPPKLKLGKELAAGAPGGAKEVKEMELEGVIPPKLNVPVGDKELN